ncbi:PREDICTED: tripartite motif-containing protein 3-like [Branchiostoma belcheri]|uniref:RING-type E3 ubiquitin transferase n=1 Tax=Branchiostoma belcheri TaxID=7741 RepID=A0A6P4ZJM0_BRABE|nr:PREDICTED: tripartite motif-containing protein 3-like [Branchiostoma belcheri]
MAAAPSTLREQICEELPCSICLELFTRPKVLPCQHTFCQDCLQDHAGRGGAIQCPICRQQVRLPPQGVAGLPDNHLVTNLCERVSGVTLGDYPQTGSTCSSHPSMTLKVYCKQCQIPVCDQCLEEVHDGHATTAIKKAARDRKTTVQALITEGRNIVEGYCSFLKGLREREKTLNEEKQKTDKSIIQAYNQTLEKLTKTLGERKDCLLSKSENNHQRNLKGIQNERDRVLADVNELSGACDQAEQDMEKRDVEFLCQDTSLTHVVEKYKLKAAPIPVQTQPAVHVFQPTSDTSVPGLGHVMVQSLPSSKVSAAPRPKGQLHGNQMQGSHQSQKVTFGKEGSEKEHFNDPVGVAVSDKDSIFVADSRNKRIQVFNMWGTFVYQFPTVVSGKKMMDPQDVASDREGNLWVVGKTESTGFAVQYSTEGKAQGKFELQKEGWGRGVAVDTRRNHILITQTTGKENNRRGEVLVYKPDGPTAQKFQLFCTISLHEMKFPRYISVGKEGNILVSDHDNHCVYVFNDTGQLLFKFGGEGSGEGQLQGPSGICITWEGNIVVADTVNGRLELFSSTGKFLRHIAKDMMRPLAVAMTSLKQLVVTDDIECTVTIFHKY